MVALAAIGLALQPAAPPPPPRREPVSAVNWSCDLRTVEGRPFSVRGTIEEIPPEPNFRMTKGRILFDDSGTMTLGEHNAGLLNSGRGVRRAYSMAVSGGGRTYYHFAFKFYDGEIGTVTVEQQILDRQPEVFKGFATGFCWSQYGAD